MLKNPLPKLLANFPEKNWRWELLLSNPAFDGRLIENYLANNSPSNIPWQLVSKNPNLTLDLIEKYQAHLDWKIISTKFEISSDFLAKYEKHIIWDKLLSNPTFTSHRQFCVLVRKYFSHFSALTSVYWEDVSIKARLTIDLITLFSHKLGLYQLLINETLTMELLDHYLQTSQRVLFSDEFSKSQITQIILHDLYISKGMSPNLAIFQKYEKWLDWTNLSYATRLPLEFIDHFARRLDWSALSKNSIFISDLVKKYPQKINWTCVYDNRCFVPDLISEYQYGVNWQLLSIRSPRISDFAERFPQKIDWKKVAKNGHLTWDFIKKWQHQLDFSCYGFRFPCNMTLDFLENNQPLFEFIRQKRGKLGFTELNNLSFNSARIQIFNKYSLNELKAKYPCLDMLTFWDWGDISRSKFLTPRVIENYQEYIDWQSLSSNKGLTFETISKYHHLLDWTLISLNNFDLNREECILSRFPRIQKIRTEISEFFCHRYCRQYAAVLDMLKMRIRDLEMGLRESMI